MTTSPFPAAVRTITGITIIVTTRMTTVAATTTHLPSTGGFRLGGLVAIGVSGGLVPCPEALKVMIIAIGLNRVLLGLGLIVSFSLGLASVLIAIGILLVRSRALVERFEGLGSRWSSALPLASAVIVTVLGVGITLRGLVPYLG